MNLLTPAEAAKFLSVSTKHLRSLTMGGHLRYVNIGTGAHREQRRYALGDLEAFIETRTRLGGLTFVQPPMTRTAVVGIDFQALRKARADNKRKKPKPPTKS